MLQNERSARSTSDKKIKKEKRKFNDSNLWGEPKKLAHFCQPRDHLALLIVQSAFFSGISSAGLSVIQ